MKAAQTMNERMPSRSAEKGRTRVKKDIVEVDEVEG